MKHYVERYSLNPPKNTYGKILVGNIYNFLKESMKINFYFSLSSMNKKIVMLIVLSLDIIELKSV